MNPLFNKSGCELIYLASSFATVLSQGLNSEEVGLLAAFFVSIGDNLAILALQCGNNNNNS